MATYSATGQVSAPILQIAKTHGDEQVAEAQYDQAKAKLSDQVQQVNQDVRDAILDIQSAEKLVDAARSNVQLATEALNEAQQRFKAGVSDSLPVSQALAQDEQANDQYISALYQHNVAKLSLGARAGCGIDELQGLSRREVDVADQNQHGQQGQTAEIQGTVQIKPQGGQQGHARAEEGRGGTGEEEPPANHHHYCRGDPCGDRDSCFYWRSTFTEDTDDAQVDGNLYQVSSRVAGQVVQVDVEEQQTVHKGDPIAEVDPRDFQVALEQAQANLANARAEYEQAQVNVPITSVTTHTQVLTSTSDVASTEAAVSQAEAQAAAANERIQQAKANALKAQIDVDRYTPLVKNDVISKQQFDQAVATSTADQAALNEAERTASASQDQIRQARARLAQALSQQHQSQQTAPKQVAAQIAREQAALAEVQQAQARLDQAKLNMGYTKIVAPIDGIVSRKTVAVGVNLSVGTVTADASCRSKTCG